MFLTPMVQRLVIANVLVYVAILIVSNPTYSEFFCLHKSSLLIPRPDDDFPFLPLQLVTSFFSHSKYSFMHILFNMLTLISFGGRMEIVMGSKRFLQFYLFCGFIGSLLITFLDPSPVPVVGASGAIFGVLTAFALYFPTEKLTIFVPIPLTFTARTWIIILGLLSAGFVLMGYLRMGSGVTGGISHFGHLAGMIAALVFFYILPLFKRN